MNSVRTALSRPVTLVSVVFIVLIFCACLAAPLIAPYSPIDPDPRNALQLPSGAHWLGTDVLGRDILTRLLYGGRIGLFGPVWAVSVAALIGVPAGLIAGYRQGWVDSLASRTMDILLAVPGIIILLTVVSIFGRNTWLTMSVLGVLMSPNFMLLVRGETIALSRELFVDAARASGSRGSRIMLRQLLPNLVSPIIVQYSLAFAIALLIGAGLGFLGLSEPPPTPSWGGMIQEAAQEYGRAPWLIFPSGGIITLVAVAFNLAGAGLRDASTERGVSRTIRAPKQALAVADGTTGGAEDVSTEATTGATGDGAELLTVRGLSVGFATGSAITEVISRVDLTISPGEKVALVGESGSGKSVTALAILGLLPGSGSLLGGSVRFDGMELTTLPERQQARLRGKRIAFISQDPMLALDPCFTVMSQLSEIVRGHHGLGAAAARRRVLELLAAVGLPNPEAIARQFPFQLSGGMAQRVAIAIAISGDPDFLIADEPTTALDVTTQAEILDLLRDLAASRGLAVLLVTHDFGVVADFCDRAVVMYAGQIVETGTVEEIFADPSHPYTAILLQADPHRAEVGKELPALPGQVPLPRDWPQGCRLAERCPLATAACAEQPVELIEVVPGHRSRCIRLAALKAGQHV
ncbi:MAG: dipeptide/oligopeptide/nickel ABC transporter permease/ATP-binding protein [Propionibacteriaceae bacterium]|jgi:peptide/nickel transport system permease protein|nr:dipeptide/oligopeptide/nickel ABC transporter permease/ATP-binding protein [Propionibacteriaceae bacterium]